MSLVALQPEKIATGIKGSDEAPAVGEITAASDHAVDHQHDMQRRITFSENRLVPGKMPHRAQSTRRRIRMPQKGSIHG